MHSGKKSDSGITCRLFKKNESRCSTPRRPWHMSIRGCCIMHTLKDRIEKSVFFQTRTEPPQVDMCTALHLSHRVAVTPQDLMPCPSQQPPPPLITTSHMMGLLQRVGSPPSHSAHAATQTRADTIVWLQVSPGFTDQFQETAAFDHSNRDN